MSKRLVFASLIALFAAAALPAAAAAQVTKTFCVDGTSNGRGWTWVLQGVGLPSQQVTTDGVPSGGSATDLARRWVDSINRAQGRPPAYRAAFVRAGADGKAYFTVTAGRDFSFGVDGCTITGNPTGCRFNPTVLEVPEVPGGPEAGDQALSRRVIIIIVIVLVVIVIIIVIVRRRR